jgi:hypothetical protein
LDVGVDAATRINNAHSDDPHTDISVVFHIRSSLGFLDSFHGGVDFDADGAKFFLLSNPSPMGIENLVLLAADVLG